MLQRARPALPFLLVALAACGAHGRAADDVRPATPPTRIVAGSVLAAEVLLAIAPRECLAAVHYVAADPRYSLVAAGVQGLARVGAEPEDLLAVAPDLVVVDAYTRPETLALLGAAAVPVLRTGDATDFAGIATNIRRIGRACHRDAEAAALVAALEQRLAELRARGRELPAIRLMSLSGGMETLGKGALFDAVITAAGARNVAAENGVGPFRTTNVEYVLAWHPDALVVMSSDERTDREWIAQTAGFAHLPAVAHGCIAFVPAALFGTTSHHVVDTVAFVQDALRRWAGR